MRVRNLYKQIAALVFGFALLFGGIVASSVTSRAQYPNDRNAQGRRDNGQRRERRQRSYDSYPNWGGSFQLRQTALNAGYNEGVKEGRKDFSKNRRADYSSKGAYQKATQDYSSKFGDRELYQRYYRLAYQTGYEDGVNGY